MHVKDGKRDEYHQSDDLLHYLQLRQGERSVADAVCRHLKEILKKGNAPTGHRRNVPGTAAQRLEMPVPGEGHEQVGTYQQRDSLNGDACGWHGISFI
jgi:hypothetical protein